MKPTICSAFFSMFLIAGAAMAIEEPAFQVTSKTDPYEIRQYGPVLVAETEVRADFDQAGNQAFKILADYIFGNNQSKKKISMTAPVTQAEPSTKTSEKISMTAPVNMTQTKGGYVVQFTMPADLTLETVPTPNDPRVKIRTLEPRSLAVFTYSGSWSKSRYDKKLEEFRAALQKDGVQTKGEPVLARFNSPFTLWFLRRNEIWIEVTK